MSQFLQTAQGRTPLQAGAQLLVWSATGLFVAPIAGRLAGRHGNQPFMLAGLLMQTAGPRVPGSDRPQTYPVP
jgi:MFS family permease